VRVSALVRADGNQREAECHEKEGMVKRDKVGNQRGLNRKVEREEEEHTIRA